MFVANGDDVGHPHQLATSMAGGGKNGPRQTHLDRRAQDLRAAGSVGDRGRARGATRAPAPRPESAWRAHPGYGAIVPDARQLPRGLPACPPEA